MGEPRALTVCVVLLEVAAELEFEEVRRVELLCEEVLLVDAPVLLGGDVVGLDLVEVIESLLA